MKSSAELSVSAVTGEESVPYTKNGALKALTNSSPAMGPNASPMTRSVPMHKITGIKVSFERKSAMLEKVNSFAFINRIMAKAEVFQSRLYKISQRKLRLKENNI